MPVLVELEAGAWRGTPGRGGGDRSRPLMRSPRLGASSGDPLSPSLVVLEEMLVELEEGALGRGTSGRLGGDSLGVGRSTLSPSLLLLDGCPLEPALVGGGMMEHSGRVDPVEASLVVTPPGSSVLNSTGPSLSPIITVIVVELTLIVAASIATVSDVSS